jgi:hypothetical protein
MRRALAPRPSLFFAAGLVAAFVSRQGPAEEPRYTLEEVAARLHAWEARIDTLRVHAHTQPDPQAKMAVKAGVGGIKRDAYDDWIWTKSGRIHHHHWVTYDGRPTTMRSLSADSPSGSWTASFTNSPDGVTPSEVTPSAGRASGNVPTPLFGLWLGRARGGWLSSAIERGMVELVEVAELDGRPCVHLRRNEGRYSQDFWLDPEHDFLPVLVETPLSSKYIVEEFSEPEPGFFFPKRGRFLHRHDGEVLQAEDWEITAVELNQSIPPSLWDPPVVPTNEQGLAARAGGVADEARWRLSSYGDRVTTLDFWLESGFLVLAIVFLVGVVAVFATRRGKHADRHREQRESGP